MGNTPFSPRDHRVSAKVNGFALCVTVGVAIGVGATDSVGDGVGVGVMEGVGVGDGNSERDGVGEADGAGAATPFELLTQTNFFPFLVQIKLKPFDFFTCPAFEHTAPALTAEFAFIAGIETSEATESIIRSFFNLFKPSQLLQHPQTRLVQ